MKAIFNYICIGFLGCTALSACSDTALETSPTVSIPGDKIVTNTNHGLSALNGIYRSMYKAGWSTDNLNTHQCFGISAYNLMADVMGEDLIMASSGSGWFWNDCVYNVKARYTSKGARSYDLWNAYYTWIANANYLIAAEGTMAGTKADVNYIMGQAYSIRAYSYFMLAQTFARTYKGHENEPCCPVYTEPTTTKTQGKARSTVQEVYQRVKADLAKGTDLLKGLGQRHISHMGYAVTLGIQARVALVMEDWGTAQASAEAAIRESGRSVLPVESFKGLNSTKARNVMWGAEIIADQSGMYASLFSHMDAAANKYGASALKQINKKLYAEMGTNDARKSWWNPTYKDNGKGGYQQEKFKFSDIKTWTGDYVWMRVEEMWLAAAESACRQGDDPTAVKYLMELMKHRDKEYTCTKTGTAIGALTSDETGSLLEEIITQRRIELWGEFGRIYDIRRLKQGFKRTTDMGWTATSLLTGRNSHDPESYMWVLTIPQSEFDGNVNMDAKTDQNPTDDVKK